MFTKLQVVLCVLWFGHLESKASFHNFKLVRIHLNQDRHLDLIDKWTSENDVDFDVWNDFKGLHRPIDVLISPQAFKKFQNLFKTNDIVYKLINPDIQKAIDQEKGPKMLKRKRFVLEDIVGTFASYPQIMNFISELVFFNPLYVFNYTIGRSFEQRELKVLQIKTPTAKRKVWIDCGIHAREWISVASCVYLMDKLITDYNNNDEFTVRILDNFEIHILPILNPDGYDYSFKLGLKYNRMWRKNRNPNNGRCSGVDLNRNFGFHWLSSGSSGTPCSEIYAGRAANSEPEVRAVQKALLSRSNWQVYLTLHSYGNFWFTPWGYTFKLPHDYHDLASKAQMAVDALKKVNGSIFSVGSSANLLCGSEDWAKGIAGIKYSYCVELGPKDDENTNGFIVPESDIEISGLEVYEAVRALLNSILSKY